MSDVDIVEQRVLDWLQRRYIADGFSFHRHPTGQLLPPFLDQYSPDAIALSPRENVVFEIKSRRRPEDRWTFARMADLLSKQEGWRFELVYADDLTSQGGDLSPAPQDSIREVLDEAQTLSRTGHERVAFVLAWSLLEALARLRTEPGSQGPKSPGSVVEFLERQGVIQPEVARRLRDLIQSRNAVVHGDLSRRIERADVEFLIATAQSLADSARSDQ